MSGFWLPLTTPLCGVDQRGVVHAIEPGEALAVRRTRRRTVPRVCDGRRARFLVHDAVNEEGEVHGVVVASWPPPVKVHARCRDCWESTGRKRPHPSWKHVTPVEEAS